MTPDEAWTTALRMQRLAIRLARAEAQSAATGRPLPPDFPQTVAMARATVRSFEAALSSELARQRFRARYPAG